jgi:hypothetical protein
VVIKKMPGIDVDGWKSPPSLLLGFEGFSILIENQIFL